MRSLYPRRAKWPREVSHILGERRRRRWLSIQDKYTTFSPHDRGYRKSVHKVPKWTKVRNYYPLVFGGAVADSGS